MVLEPAKGMYSPDAWSQARCILVKLGEESTKAIFECECMQINTSGPLVQTPEWGCTSDEVYVACITIYLHARWELP